MRASDAIGGLQNKRKLFVDQYIRFNMLYKSLFLPSFVEKARILPNGSKLLSPAGIQGIELFSWMFEPVD